MKFENNATLKAFFLLAVCFLLSACGVGNEQSFKEAVEVNSKNIIEITINSANDRVRVGETEAYSVSAVVEGEDSNTVIDISSSVSWSTSDSSIVAINSEGIATGIANGTVDIIARISDLTATKSLSSSDAALVSIELSGLPDDILLCRTLTEKLVATGTYADGGQANISDKVSWSSSDTSTVYIGDQDLSDQSRNDKGVLSGLSVGQATITASQANIVSAGVDISVVSGIDSITLSSSDSEFYAGTSTQFWATGTYTSGTSVTTIDITENVSWNSSNTDSLSFSDSTSGLAQLLNAGSVNVSAACGSVGTDHVQSEELSVIVEDPVTITSLIIEEGSNRIEDGDDIKLDLEDVSVQLKLYTLDSSGAQGDDELSEDRETTFSVIGSPLSGDAATISKNGLVSFSATGESEYQVLYKNDDEGINVSISFFIEVE